MLHVEIDNERFSEKDLLALPGRNLMAFEDFGCVPRVPIKPGRPGEQGVDILHVVAHVFSIYRVYTSVKKESREA
jgi:hypothetical protein